MTLNEILEIAKTYRVPECEVNKILKHYADLGCIIYFDSSMYHDLIIFQPKWLISALATFIYDVDVHGTRRRLVGDNVDLYEQTGLLAETVLFEKFWGQLYLKEEKEYLIRLCLKKLIVTEYDFVDENSAKKMYLVPSMAKDSRQWKLPTEALTFGFLFEPAVPNGFFQHFLCSLITKCANLRSTSKPDIGQSTAYFTLRYNDEFYLWVALVDDEIRFTLESCEMNLAFPFLSVISQDLYEKVLRQECVSNVKVKTFVEAPAKGVKVFYESLKKRHEQKKMTVESTAKGGETFKISLFECWLPPVGKAEYSYDCFLAHTWGQGNSIHNRVRDVALLLRNAGLKVWFDEDLVHSDPAYAIEHGLRESRIVLVFLTEEYFERLEDRTSNAYKEFTSAVLRNPDLVIPIAFEEKFTNEFKWPASVARFHLSSSFRFHMIDDIQVNANIDKLVEHIQNL